METKIKYADLLEILFESRNKTYGTYQLRKNEKNNILKGLGVSVLAATTLFLLVAFQGPLEQKALGVEYKNELDTIPFVLPAKAKAKESQSHKKAEEQASPPQKSNQEKRQELVPVKDELAKNTTTLPSNDSAYSNLDGGSKLNPGGNTQSGSDSIGDGIDDKDEDDKEFEDMWVQVSPKPENLNQIKQMVKYPRALFEMGIEGIVRLRLLVGKDGKIERVEVQNSPHPLFSHACLEPAKMLKFLPGKQAGKPVKVWVTLPFRFSKN